MATAKVFKSGNSQAIRLPKDFRVESKELEITRTGKGILLVEKESRPRTGIELYEALVSGPGFSEDFELSPEPFSLLDSKAQRIIQGFNEPPREAPTTARAMGAKRKSR